MPGWLTWTLVALAAWLAASIVAAFALGRLFRPLRQAEPTVNMGGAASVALPGELHRRP
jgi:hypothetical protein